jgi:F-type H+-transporting ATPase subunit alpha
VLNNQAIHKKGAVAKFEIHEEGTVKSVRECVLTAAGLPSCINGQIVELPHGGQGMVLGFDEDDVQILVLISKGFIRTGDKVYSKGQFLQLPVGEAFLGRVVNSLCEPVDGLGEIAPSDYLPVFAEVPGVLDRVPVEKTLETGTLILDAVIPIAKGQRQLFIGDRLTGKTTVAIDAIINQKGKDVVCIYCCVGKTHASLLKIFDIFREKEVMPYTIVVSGVASASMGEQYLAPYTAAMLGEYFMNKGRDVFVVFDDLTKHAWVYRQISLLLERAPGREAYPGDIFYIHSQLMERAGYLKPELGGGSMTFFPIVEILQGDVTGYISTNIISMTDGQTYFNTGLFYKGTKPAIDFGLSVSRIGSKAQWPGMKELSKKLRLEYIQYQELLQMTQLRTTALSKDAEDKLRRGQAISQLLIQDRNDPIPMEVEISFLFALGLGVLDNLSTTDIKIFKQKFIEKVGKMYPELLPEIRKSQALSDSSKEKLQKALAEYFQNI